MQFLESYALDLRSGAALPYAVATVYLAGTGTLAALFDNVGAPISNPVTADPNGLVGFAAANGAYDISIRSADGSYTMTIPDQQLYDLTGLDAQVAAAVAAGVLAATAITSASAATVAAAIKNILATTVTAGGTLPFEVTGISGGVGTGTGGTPGVYNGGVSGGPSGFQWSYTIDASGKLALPYTIINPGISTSNSAPTLSFASGTGLSGATLPTATVSTILVNRMFYAPSSDGTQLLAWGNSAGSLQSAPFSGTQLSMATSAAVAPFTNTAPAGAAFSVDDAFGGNSAWYVDANGVVNAKSLTTDTFAGMKVSELQRRLLRSIMVPADIIGVPFYGQSKSLGQAAGVGTYATSIPGSPLMFNANGSASAGPRVQEGAAPPRRITGR